MPSRKRRKPPPPNQPFADAYRLFPQGWPELGETLCVHMCCAPDAAGTFAQLAPHYRLVAYWHDPNVQPKSEHDLRRDEARRTCEIMNVPVHEGPYDVRAWMKVCAPMAAEPEKGPRCDACFDYRLVQTAEFCREQGIASFVTTLTISPHKLQQHINAIGAAIGKRYGLRYVATDLKKAEGFTKGAHLAREHNIYRQTYCGCVWSYTDTPEGRVAKPGTGGG
jgi:predicted adenine nucleotide alpha hydrolase (AANH) superfamily ATPase